MEFTPTFQNLWEVLYITICRSLHFFMDLFWVPVLSDIADVTCWTHSFMDLSDILIMETTLQIFHNSSLLKYILCIGDAKLTIWWSYFKFPSYWTSLTWPVGLTPLWIYRIFWSWKRRFRFFIVHRSLYLFYPMHHRCEAELSGGLTPIFQMYKYLVKIFIRLHFFQISLISAF